MSWSLNHSTNQEQIICLQSAKSIPAHLWQIKTPLSLFVCFKKQACEDEEVAPVLEGAHAYPHDKAVLNSGTQPQPR